MDLLRGLPSVVAKLGTLSPDDCGLSAITSFELYAGAARARNPPGEAEKIQKLLDVIAELPFEAEAARRAGALRAKLEEAGKPIGPYDLLIAAQALALDLALVSGNKSEFGRVAGLRVESWR